MGPIKGASFPCLEASGDQILFFYEGLAIEPKKLSAFIDETIEVLKTLIGDIK